MGKIIAINKPVGFSTYDIIRLYKRQNGFTGKIGHGGTLDPFACGVVLLLLGEATKQFEAMRAWEKVYLAGIRLGAISTTQDVEGEIEYTANPVKPKREEILEILKDFEGEIEQKVPAYAAAKHKGVPLYKLAQQGKEVAKSKRVTIKQVEFVVYKWPLLTIRVTALGGTYIRQLTADIGQRLKTGGFLYFLQRERVGQYSLCSCLDLEHLE